MISTIFHNYFYSLITPPNKEQLIKTLNDAEIDEEKTKTLVWPNACEIKVESLHPYGIGPSLATCFKSFFLELGVVEGDKDFDNVRMLSVWRNTYNKGYYQEIHNHLGFDGADLSGVVFLNDHVDGASQFYFYNKEFCEISPSWMKIMNNMKKECQRFLLTPKAGDVLLFPSYMLHGVTMHKINQPRTTVSFNIAFR